MTMNDEVFFVTTDLVDFYTISEPVVYAGDWCIPYSHDNKRYNEIRNVIPSPFSSGDNVASARSDINSLLERILNPLAETLNFIHNTQYSIRYWRIIVSFWLGDFLDLIYSHYLIIEEAEKQFQSIKTQILDSTDYFVVKDLKDFHLTREDPVYHLQLFSRMIPYSKVQWEKKRFFRDNTPLSSCFSSHSLVSGFVRSFEFFMNRYKTVIHNKKLIYCYSPDFSLFLRFNMYFRCPNLGFIDNPDLKNQNFSLSQKNRDDATVFLNSVFQPENRFEKIVADILFQEIPLIYLEGYRHYSECAREFARDYHNPVGFFSSSVLWNDWVIKFWVAEQSESGMKILYSQHGGDYGAYQCASFEREYAVADVYYSWGWNSPQFPKIVPMPSLKLHSQKLALEMEPITPILFGTVTWTRYPLRIRYHSNWCDYLPYLDWEFEFLSHLPTMIRDELLRVRIMGGGVYDHGWETKTRLLDQFPDLQIEEMQDIGFIQSLSGCRLFICDQLTTMYLEALFYNKPTILFWNPDVLHYYPEAEYYFQLLVDAGILYYNPREAASSVSKIITDVEGWWLDTSRQEAVREFCEYFSKKSNSLLKEWCHEFMEIYQTM